MSNIEESIEVGVPVRTAYNQWTQFEEFPGFMEGVQQIEQLDERTTRWTASVAGVERRFEAKITEQTPDQRVAWTVEEGEPHSGVVTFHRIDDTTTKVMLQMDYEPSGALEKIGDVLGLAKRRVKGDLARFKEMIEARGAGGETGGWRGEVEQSATS